MFNYRNQKKNSQINSEYVYILIFFFLFFIFVSSETVMFHAADTNVWSNLESGLGSPKDISDRYNSIQDRFKVFPYVLPSGWTNDDLIRYAQRNGEISYQRFCRGYEYYYCIGGNWYVQTVFYTIIWTRTLYKILEIIFFLTHPGGKY